MNENTKKKFILPQLTKIGSVEEMTQVTGAVGTVDTFTSASDPSFSFEGPASLDVTGP